MNAVGMLAIKRSTGKGEGMFREFGLFWRHSGNRR